MQTSETLQIYVPEKTSDDFEILISQNFCNSATICLIYNYVEQDFSYSAKILLGKSHKNISPQKKKHFYDASHYLFLIFNNVLLIYICLHLYFIYISYLIILIIYINYIILVFLIYTHT